jgi:ubiquinone/menaquinone biosynthesis C-methylase UbiE
MDEVLREEAEFANRDYAKHADDLELKPRMWTRYAHPTELWDWRQMAVVQLGDVAGKDMLDMGCGMGEESVYFAKLGAKVTGIDIAEVGIATLKRRAAHHNLAISALKMRADETTFPDNRFDLVHGLGILHHIGIAKGLAEVRRVLRPGGIGVFLEPMGNSPLIEVVKTWMLRRAMAFGGAVTHVTDHEENLKWKDIDAATRAFSEVRLYPYNLLFRARRLVPQVAYPLVHKLDFAVLNLAPALKRYAGAVVIRVRK